jgi:hypothetical protein
MRRRTQKRPASSLLASNFREMKHALITLLVTAVAFAQGTPSPQETSPLSTDQQNVSHAKAVLDQGIQALGGQAYLSWRTQTAEGRSYSFHHGEPNSLGTLIWRFREYPDKERIEVTKQRDIVEIINGDKGYEVTYKGVRNWDDKEELQPYLRRRHYSLDIVLREWLKQPGIALFYEGQTVAAQKEADQVTMMNAQNEAVTLYFDVNTHLPVKESYSWRDPTDKERNTEEQIFDNYRSIQGILTPFDVTRNYNGEMAAQSFLTSVSYNQDLSASMFDPNAKSEQSQKKKHH